MTAEVTKISILACQVCVPNDWKDEQAKEFAEKENPCGTEQGWVMRKQGDDGLDGSDERVKCAGRENHVHIMFDA